MSLTKQNQKTMRQTVQTVTCDLTRKKINDETPHCRIDFSLFFLDLERKKEIKRDDSDSFPKKALKGLIEVEAHEKHDVSVDLSEDIAIDVYNFLKKKYPKKMKSFEKQNGFEKFRVTKKPKGVS